MSVEKVLERIGSIKQEIVIDKNFFYCGRMKESDIVCLSLLVSREHCVFTKLSDDLYVTDLGSSNGVFINGNLVRAKKQILLQENDYIGIGCPNINNLDETMFVYRVKNRVVTSSDSNGCSSINGQLENVRLSRKEQSKLRIAEDLNMPAKIPRTSRDNERISVNRIDNNIDDDIIEIVDCIENRNLTEQKIEKHNLNNKSNYLASTSKVLLERTDINNVKKEINSCSSTTSLLKSKPPSPKKEISDTYIDIIDITDSEILDFPSTRENNNENQTNSILPVYPVKEEPIELDNKPNIDVNIKQEPNWNNFSQIDIVEINDDDDSIFPFSQLFDQSSIKKECEDNDEDKPCSSLFLDDDDENIITILDSDDENDRAFNTAVPTMIQIKKEQCSQLDSITIDEKPNGSHEDNMVVVDASAFSDEVTSTEMQSVSTNINKIIETLTEDLPQKKVSSNKELIKPSTSKVSTSIKVKKGLEIVEPHFMKLKKKTAKSSKKEEKDSKDKDKKSERKKHSDKKKDSSTGKEKSKESHSKHDKDKKDKNVSSSSSKKSSNEKSKHKKHIEDKHKSSSSEHSKNKSHSAEKSETEKSDESFNKDDSSSTANTSSNSEINNHTRPKHKTTKVKVKVSVKTRGDMLCDSMQTLRPKPKRKNEKKVDAKSKTEASKNNVQPNSLSTFVIPRRQIPSSSLLPNSLSMVSQLNSPLPQNISVSTKPTKSTIPTKPTISTVPTIPTSNVENVTTALTNGINNIRLPSPSPMEIDNDDENIAPELPPSPPPVEQHLKPSLVMPSLLNASNKKVSFKENIVSVREFPIQEGNRLRNVKEGLSMKSTRRDLVVYKAKELKIEDFLARIFVWEPVWLEQQQKVKELPPIVKPDEMLQLRNTFITYEEYYKRMEVLLLLETWQLLVKEYECSGNRYNSSVSLPCSILRHSIKQMQTPNGLRYSMLVINTLVSKSQLRLQNHPVYGDMIIIEYVIKQAGVQKIRRAFAYVLQVQQQNSLKFLRSNQHLSKFVKQPDALLTYFVQTRIIDEHIVQFDQVARLRSILYIRSHLRLIQGLQFVPHSSLRDLILKVHIDEYQLDKVTQKEILEYELVTKEKLNDKQMEAIVKFTSASVKLKPKIGLLVGPPGTGKSKVIANLVTQILYGNGRYVNGKPLRILVCAPSNAAIDEIVLRLLDIRGAIKDHRFKMVRIGRMESMHEEVKKISISELAKREAQKSYIDQHQKTSENIEHRKHKLKCEIEALEILAANNRNNKMYKRDLEELKVQYKNISKKSPEQEGAELNKLENAAKNIILLKADVIACTLSSCYTSQMETIFGSTTEKIATCIVDEATQCCEAETLIPLMLGVQSLILVGDPNQLPATVMSTEAKKLGLDRSLFTRAKDALELQYDESREDCKDPVIMLNVQYRMVNAISHWPNKFFYGGKLKDCVNYKYQFPFQPYRILNLDGLQDDIKFSNTSEAVFVGNLINCMMTCAKISGWDKKITIGVITPYQNQKSLILSTIKEQIKNVPDNVQSKFVTEVNTIDSFQGQERDVIIMSCVRSCGIGFLSDQQRLCVALTRAKFTLIICGNFVTFQKDNTWKNLLHDARSRGVVVRLNTSAKPAEIRPHVARLD